jgi:hypothetical protein
MLGKSTISMRQVNSPFQNLANLLPQKIIPHRFSQNTSNPFTRWTLYRGSHFFRGERPRPLTFSRRACPPSPHPRRKNARTTKPRTTVPTAAATQSIQPREDPRPTSKKEDSQGHLRTFWDTVRTNCPRLLYCSTFYCSTISPACPEQCRRAQLSRAAPPPLSVIF